MGLELRMQLDFDCADFERPETGFRPSLVFQNGRLLEFERDFVTVMQPWPDPLAWRRTLKGLFKPMRPKITLLPFDEDDTPAEDLTEEPEYVARQEFMAPVPLAEKRAISKFPARQWHMMDLLACCPGSLDLVQSTPALAYALASNWVFRNETHNQPPQSSCRLVLLPQREIAGWLGFPARQSTVRVLRKLVTCDISIEGLLQLRDGLWDEDSAMLLRHCSSITREVMAFATVPERRRHFSPRFLAELPTYGLNFTSDSLQRLLSPQILGNLDPSMRFDSMEQVKEFVAEYETIQREAVGREQSFCQFSPPPIPGIAEINPLINSRELADEGRIMRHCVAGYEGLAACGHSYFYRVTAPERATLALIREGGKWRLDQIHGPRNAKVGPETKSFVQSWFSTFGGAVAGRNTFRSDDGITIADFLRRQAC
jgi:hypothetical protein